MKNHVVRLTVLGAVIMASIIPMSAQAWTSGALVKGSKPNVYYVTNKGKKLSFPDEQTYFSWYTDFNKVQTISDASLAALPLAGYATIRPGTKMVKVKNINKVYAVSRGEILRWVKTETVAKALYGNTWSQQVVTMPTEQFQNYRIGEDITNSSQYSPADEQADIKNLNDELSVALTIRGFTP